MWYKVTDLKSNGLNKSQISYETGLDRKTVRKYLSMSASEFQEWVLKGRNVDYKLSPYYRFVKEQLKAAEFLSAAQIEDRLKEHFPEMPRVHSKTIYNFVKMVREKEDIIKPNFHKERTFIKIPECGYGQQAQVDFGEIKMKDKYGKKIKVYFFAMVLSRSRQKFAYYQSKPFTSETSIYAHQLSFEYFQGIPKEIVYDQDSVFMKDENLGDLLLTEKFKRYCDSQPFNPVFCRKADPQSKGKVENVVKYIKYNYLRGRIYIDDKILNKEGLQWLKRTGNCKKHATTLKRPYKEWLIEKDYLLPLKGKVVLEKEDKYIQHHVRKDNTIAYKGNIYSVPLGTYKGKGSYVFIKVINSELNIYTDTKSHLATHTISAIKGKYICQSDHHRDKKHSIEQRYQQVLEFFRDKDKAQYYLSLIKLDKPRYFHDHLRIFCRELKTESMELKEKTLSFCIENKLLNAYRFCEVMEYYKIEQEEEIAYNIEDVVMPKSAAILPNTSNLDIYESLM